MIYVWIDKIVDVKIFIWECHYLDRETDLCLNVYAAAVEIVISRKQME